MNHLKKYNLLTLDPMYSPLHNRIANLVAVNKYAILSCNAKKIYLNNFKTVLATQLISEVSLNSCANLDSIYEQIKTLVHIHSAYVKKIENRQLTQSEIRYMSRYYIAFEEYIIKNQINLVIMHNDQRWYHAVAILVCKKYKVKYLVTEQGLIRPHTTVIDNVGVNANSSLAREDKTIFESSFRILPKFKVKSSHDSTIAVIYFSVFIMIFSLERYLNSKSILRYMHNNYTLKKYVTRLKLKISNRFFKKNTRTKCIIHEQYVLLLLQLETDSQIIVHSNFINNQQIITEFENALPKIKIKIKKHPLDMNNYEIAENTNFIGGDIKTLSIKAKAVFTINSSSALAVINTDTPLFLLGESIYAHEGVAKFITINDLPKFEEHLTVNRDKRQKFLNYINNYYLVSGAGWSYDDKVLSEKLSRLLKNN